MLLALDIGNTDTVIGLFKGEILFFQKRIPTPEILRYAQNDKSKHIDSAIISSVVPSLDKRIKKELKKNISLNKILFVTHRLKLPIRLLVDRPKEVGADRIVNNSAAFEKYKQPLLVIDLGMATTVDYIDTKGNYRGGLIIPGLKISAQALFDRAAKLPIISFKAPKKLLGKNTVHQMQSGIVQGYAAMIDGVIAKIQKEIHQKPKIILTGGLGHLLSPLLSFSHVFDPLLTLRGLCLLAKINKK